MGNLAIWSIAVLGGCTLFGVFYRMKDGFGPFNLRVTGIVLIALLTSIIAIEDHDSISSAMGILGAIAGYLFGTTSQKE